MIGIVSRIGAIMVRPADLVARARGEANVLLNPDGLRAQIAFLRDREVTRLKTERGR